MKNAGNRKKRTGFFGHLYQLLSPLDKLFEGFPIPLPVGTILFVLIIGGLLFGAPMLLGLAFPLIVKILSYIIMFSIFYFPIHYLVKWKFGYEIPVLGFILGLFKGKFSISKGQSKESFSINNATIIENPYAGVFISGGAGSGKSKSLIEPLIKESGKKGYTGVIYDFKFPELAQYVNTAYKESDIKPYFINFTDLSRSNRVNPIAPEFMQNESFAREFAYTILANLNPQMISKPDFWSDNSTSLLASIFWYLKQRHPKYCTLPHAMSMILQPDLESLLNTLSQEQKCADMIAPIMTAYANKADNQLAGVISSLQISLSKINTEEVYYLTSKSDFNLDLNNPNDKGLLVIGNSPTLATTYSPIIGLILTSISKLLNQQGKEKSVFMLDEFPTVYVPNIEQLPATARSNKVATILACQDISQMVDKYGKEKSESILNNLGNQFFGRTPSIETARRVQALFGTMDKEMVSTSYGESTSTSYSERESNIVKLQDLANLNTGTFYTTLAEGKKRQGISSIKMDNKFMKTQIESFNQVSKTEVERVYTQVKNDIEHILIRI